MGTGKWTVLLDSAKCRTAAARGTLLSLYNVREELILSPEGCLMRGPQLVIPGCLQQRVVDLAHQGVVKTKSRLRTKVWFPGLDALVENTVLRCALCQAAGVGDSPAPIIMEDIPSFPWQRASADFGCLPNGRHMLVVIDDFSKYPEDELLATTTAGRTIPLFKKIMAMHGLFTELRTDNVPPFSSHTFALYLQSRGVRHRKVTLLWPQANGEAECFMRTLN